MADSCRFSSLFRLEPFPHPKLDIHHVSSVLWTGCKHCVWQPDYIPVPAPGGSAPFRCFRAFAIARHVFRNFRKQRFRRQIVRKNLCNERSVRLSRVMKPSPLRRNSITISSRTSAKETAFWIRCLHFERSFHRFSIYVRRDDKRWCAISCSSNARGKTDV